MTALTFIIGHDGSHHADNALNAAIKLGQPAEARLVVVFVRHHPGALAASATATVEHEHALDQIAEQLHQELRGQLVDYPGHWQVEQRSGKPAEELINAAIHHAADAVFIGHRGHNPITDLIIGSTATRLLQNSPAAVVVTR